MRRANLLPLSMTAAAILTFGLPGHTQGPQGQQGPQFQLSQILDKSVQMLRSGHPMEAVAFLQRARNQFPQSATIRFQIGNGYSDAKNYPAAIAEYGEALKLQPKFAGAVLNTAYAYVNAGQYDLSMPWFERYLGENPTASNLADVKSQMLTAQAAKAAKAKRYFDAKNLMEQACQINPTSHSMHYQTCTCLR